MRVTVRMTPGDDVDAAVGKAQNWLTGIDLVQLAVMAVDMNAEYIDISWSTKEEE